MRLNNRHYILYFQREHGAVHRIRNKKPKPFMNCRALISDVLVRKCGAEFPSANACTGKVEYPIFVGDSPVKM